MKKKADAETLLGIHLRENFPTATIVREYQFHVERKWRFDWAIPVLKYGFECEGGIWIQGGHTRGKGFQDNLEKYNTATLLGWKVFRFSVEDILKGRDLFYLAG